jgi:Uma2 family endonuclease
MSMTLPPPSLPPTPTGRKRWTRDDCTFLERAGLLTGRYELIDGEIIVKTGQNRPHALAVSLLLAWLFSLFGARRVQTQATMEVRADDQGTNRPEPDVLVLREPTDQVPTGEDALLVVEVSDSSQADDLGFKVDLYARAGVEEYWVLDISRRRLVAFRTSQNGTYTQRDEFDEGETVAPFCTPENPMRVADLIG